jgi:ABC-type antimicrobial peptide transport system permease subunit
MIAPGVLAGTLLVAVAQLPLATWTESRVFDVQTLLPAIAVLVLFGSVAALLPVRRVLALTPVRILRSE